METSRRVKSFVMFDTETTGLPSPGNNPHITELCFIAATREELQSKHNEPRVINKLSLCLNPHKRISPKSSDITGLHNDSLDCMATFAQQADVIISFLQTLPEPACILAHNGHDFDFPLLMAELQRANKSLPGTILCADTLYAFRVFDGKPPMTEHQLRRKRAREQFASDKNVCSSLCTSTTNGNENKKSLSKDESENKTLMNHSLRTETGSDGLEDTSNGEDPDFKTRKLEFIQKVNETTPDRKTNISYYNHDKDEKKREEYFDNSDATNVRKKLFSSSYQSLTPNESEKELGEKREGSLLLNDGNKISSTALTQNTPDISKLVDCGLSSKISFSSQQSTTDSEKDLLEAYEHVEKSCVSTQGSQNKPDTQVTDFERGKGVIKIETSESNQNLCSKPKSAFTVDNNEMEPMPNIKRPTTQSRSYSLGNIYKRFYGQQAEDAHTAEGDCKIMLKLVNLNIKKIIPYCDENAVLFSDVIPMYS